MGDIDWRFQLAKCDVEVRVSRKSSCTCSSNFGEVRLWEPHRSGIERSGSGFVSIGDGVREIWRVIKEIFSSWLLILGFIEMFKSWEYGFIDVIEYTSWHRAVQVDRLQSCSAWHQFLNPGQSNMGLITTQKGPSIEKGNKNKNKNLYLSKKPDECTNMSMSPFTGASLYTSMHQRPYVKA